MTGELEAPDPLKGFKAVVGHKNAVYYLNYFARAEARGYPPISWNWPVFFLGWLWLLYRRLYRWASIFFFFPYAVWLLASLVRPLLGDGLTTTVVIVLVLGFQAVYMPLKANGIYYQHAKSLLQQANQQHPARTDEQVQQQLKVLAEKGGVNPQAPFMALALIFLLISLLGQFAPASS